MTRRSGTVLALWLAGLLACALVIARTPVTADLSAFLPRSPSPAQQVLVDQLRDGLVSRLILVALEGAPTPELATLSRETASRLRGDPLVAMVGNGETIGLEADRAHLWGNRYLLSPAVTPERFTADGLRSALEEAVRLLRSPGGPLLKRVLPSDPTLEILRLTEQVSGGGGPASRDGVWVSADGARALLLIQTAAAGSNLDAQQATLARIRTAFDEARRAAGSSARLLMTGPAVFAVQTRDTIEADVKRSSILASLLVAGVLLLVYRSVPVLALALLPSATGTLAGLAAVGLGFDTVHGITLGFGVTLLGETVDYAIYLFTQTQPGTPAAATLPRIWGTLLLGMATSVVGFGSMMLSSFAGLAQLGLFSIVGLAVALCVTRWVLPVLLPAGFATRRPERMGPVLTGLAGAAPRLRPVLVLAVAVSLGWLVHRGDAVWSGTLSSLSPVAKADQALDEALRRDLGAPDVRHMLIVAAPDRDGALAAAERLAAPLDDLIRQGTLKGYETPAAILPSRAAQQARQAALPEPDRLRADLARAVEGLPFRPDIFQPFLEDVARARTAAPVDPEALGGTGLRVKLDSLLVRSGDGWSAMMPLRGVQDVPALSARLGGDAILLDIAEESDRLYRTYRQEALTLALCGAAAITVLLAAALRSLRSLGAVLLPLAASVVATMAILTALGQQLSIFHLVGLLLVVGVGSNYSLLFARPESSAALRERTITSVTIANLCTVIGFGTLSFSGIPVLHGIGMTVAVGSFLGLIFSAVLAVRRADG